MTTEIQTGDRVTVEGKAGKVEHAEVIDARDAIDMPDVPIAESNQARKYIAEDFRRVAAIEYTYYIMGVFRTQVMFTAFQDFNGVWWDLKGHPLTIVKEQEREDPPPPAPRSKERVQ